MSHTWSHMEANEQAHVYANEEDKRSLIQDQRDMDGEQDPNCGKEEGEMDVEHESGMKKRTRLSSGETPKKSKKEKSLNMGGVVVSIPSFGKLSKNTRQVETGDKHTPTRKSGINKTDLMNRKTVRIRSANKIKPKLKGIEALKEKINQCPVINKLLTSHKEDAKDFLYLNKLSHDEINAIYKPFPSLVDIFLIGDDHWKITQKKPIEISNRSISFDKKERKPEVIENYLDFNRFNKMKIKGNHYKKKILPIFSKLDQRLMIIKTNGIKEDLDRTITLIDETLKTEMSGINRKTIIIEMISSYEAIIHMEIETFNIFHSKMKGIIETEKNEKGGRGNNAFLYDYPGNFMTLNDDEPKMCIGYPTLIRRWIYEAISRHTGVAFKTDISF